MRWPALRLRILIYLGTYPKVKKLQGTDECYVAGPGETLMYLALELQTSLHYPETGEFQMPPNGS